MRALLALVSTLMIGTLSWGQQGYSILEVPVFTTTSDSVRYASLQQALRYAFTSNAEPDVVDSLMHELMQMETKITGRKKVFLGSRDFVPYDSLPFISDYDRVKKLTLSNRTTKRLPAEILHCKNLETLELVNTRVKRLGNLKQLPLLKTVHVLNNTPARPLKLSKSKSVKTVVVRMDQGNRLPRSFKKLERLETLDLATCGLVEFPKGLEGNKQLKELRLGSNRITLKAGKIASIPSLEKLELQGNGIEHLPEAIKNLPNLKRLTLTGNSIASVSPAIAELKKLEELSFYRNKLTAIPEGIYGLPALREIDLYYNQLERVDDRIANLKSLEVLYLSNNRLISLSDAVSMLPNLEELYLSNNRLAELPPSLFSLQKMKVLRVNNNQLSQFPNNLPRLTNLESLDISGNQFTEMPAGITNLPRLKMLVMMNNPWDDPTRLYLAELAGLLRSKEVIVHVEEGPEP